jgi:hypothetical protein
MVLIPKSIRVEGSGTAAARCENKPVPVTVCPPGGGVVIIAAKLNPGVVSIVNVTLPGLKASKLSVLELASTTSVPVTARVLKSAGSVGTRAVERKSSNRTPPPGKPVILLSSIVEPGPTSKEINPSGPETGVRIIFKPPTKAVGKDPTTPSKLVVIPVRLKRAWLPLAGLGDVRVNAVTVPSIVVIGAACTKLPETKETPVTNDDAHVRHKTKTTFLVFFMSTCLSVWKVICKDSNSLFYRCRARFSRLSCLLL